MKEWYHGVYLKSDSWKRHRDRVLNERGRRCELCGAPANILHHMSYNGVCEDGSFEPDENLLCVCRSCHEKIHGEWQDLADKYRQRITAIAEELVNDGAVAMTEAIKDKLIEYYPEFEQYSGMVMAVILKNVPGKDRQKIFWKLRDYYGYYDLSVIMRNMLKRTQLIPELNFNGKCEACSVRLSTLQGKKRVKYPKTLHEFVDKMRKGAKKDIERWIEHQTARYPDHEEEQPEDHPDRRAAEDRAERTV